MVDGRMIRSCLVFAIQLDGAAVETAEGFAGDPKMDALRKAFADRNALQCGFCTSGMLVAARDLLNRENAPDRNVIREFISGNFCRCTGYEAIVDAISQVANATAQSRDIT
jgi:carbon-monoxide dehydrogenase small subunit